MNKLFYVVAIILTLSGISDANCTGSSSYSTCYDQSGNTYTVTRMGNTTTVQGSASNGNQWSQTSSTYGNTTTTTGTAANGNSWNSSTYTYSNGSTQTQGTDSRGQYFSKTCDSRGNCY